MRVQHLVHLYQLCKSTAERIYSSGALSQREAAMLGCREPSSQWLDPVEEQHLSLSCYTTVLLLSYKVLLQALTPSSGHLYLATHHITDPAFSLSQKPPALHLLGKQEDMCTEPACPDCSCQKNTSLYLTFSDNSTRVYNGFGSSSSPASSVVSVHSH